uniref:Uncharacterized protein n=1 Tax=Arabidopsis thaliana TaxID=3702 RepID=Q56X63_ARATH|nr:hypothetical protein [Arabidopsis thaliana]
MPQVHLVTRSDPTRVFFSSPSVYSLIPLHAFVSLRFKNIESY